MVKKKYINVSGLKNPEILTLDGFFIIYQKFYPGKLDLEVYYSYGFEQMRHHMGDFFNPQSELVYEISECVKVRKSNHLVAVLISGKKGYLFKEYVLMVMDFRRVSAQSKRTVAKIKDFYPDE